MLDSGKDSYGVLEAIKNSTNLIAMIRTVPWARSIFSFCAPGLSKDTANLVAFATERFVRRFKQGSSGSDVKDVFAHLLAEDSDTGTKLTPGILATESVIIIIASVCCSRCCSSSLRKP